MHIVDNMGEREREMGDVLRIDSFPFRILNGIVLVSFIFGVKKILLNDTIPIVDLLGSLY